MTIVESEPTGQCPFVVNRFHELIEVSRAKGVVSDPDVFAGNHAAVDPLADTCAREYLDDILSFTEGDAHRSRRKLLNSLVRPEALENIRENIILPAFHRRIEAEIEPTGDGRWRLDLAALVEKTFLEFTAEIIGLQNVESEEAMQRLQGCVLPIFAGLTSKFFEDREAVTVQGLAAKQRFVDEFFRPARRAMEAMVAKVEAGQLPESALPNNLMRLIVTEANPAYADEAVAIRECILFFVATVGTSSQSVMHTMADLFKWFEAHPEDYEKRAELDFVLRSFQESLRLKSSYISYNTRLATEEVTVGDRMITPGQEIHLQLPLADRDPSVFGHDAAEFNPWREIPAGVSRYGAAFSAGPHQCLGLRVVLGNDGLGGGHIKLVQLLLQAGLRADPGSPPVILPMKDEDSAVADVVSFITFPVLLDNWPPVPAAQ